jgi:hypothetical protein
VACEVKGYSGRLQGVDQSDHLAARHAECVARQMLMERPGDDVGNTG